jgi:cytochrome c553
VDCINNAILAVAAAVAAGEAIAASSEKSAVRADCTAIAGHKRIGRGLGLSRDDQATIARLVGLSRAFLSSATDEEKLEIESEITTLTGRIL